MAKRAKFGQPPPYVDHHSATTNNTLAQSAKCKIIKILLATRCTQQNICQLSHGWHICKVFDSLHNAYAQNVYCQIYTSKSNGTAPGG